MRCECSGSACTDWKLLETVRPEHSFLSLRTPPTPTATVAACSCSFSRQSWTSPLTRINNCESVGITHSIPKASEQLLYVTDGDHEFVITCQCPLPRQQDRKHQTKWAPYILWNKAHHLAEVKTYNIAVLSVECSVGLKGPTPSHWAPVETSPEVTRWASPAADLGSA